MYTHIGGQLFTWELAQEALEAHPESTTFIDPPEATDWQTRSEGRHGFPIRILGGRTMNSIVTIYDDLSTPPDAPELRVVIRGTGSNNVNNLLAATITPWQILFPGSYAENTAELIGTIRSAVWSRQTSLAEANMIREAQAALSLAAVATGQI